LLEIIEIANHEHVAPGECIFLKQEKEKMQYCRRHNSNTIVKCGDVKCDVKCGDVKCGDVKMVM
jgi:hypothetical protein